MGTSGGYLHPGKLFVGRYGRMTDGTSVIRYAEFLRGESGLGDEPPIDLAPVFHRFGVSPRKVSLPDLAGLVNPERGMIFVNSDDPTARQRFSEAHELMELLFDAQSSSVGWSGRGRKLFSDEAKERLCEEGAAELLMPHTTFVPYVLQWGVSLQTGRRLAELYDVSLTAALLRAVRLGPGQHAFVLWRLALKPSEERAVHHPDQLPLFGDYTPSPPSEKLRVRWGCSTDGGPFVPPHKSVACDTSVYRCYERGQDTKAVDCIDLGTVYGRCLCESMAVTLGTERHVLSVIHLPQDEHSTP